jgi:uncharacterized protein (TIGR02270 family)
MIVESVINQHAEESVFLWSLREQAVKAPNYTLSRLAELDDRVDAHLDGLLIAVDAGWEICKEVLSFKESGEVFAAAFLAFLRGDETYIQAVLEMGSASPELSRGLVSALGWLSYPQAEKHIQKLLVAESPTLRRIGIAAYAVHRKDPGQALMNALFDGDALLKARALRAIVQLGRIELLHHLQNNLRVEDEKCRFCAAWSAALLGDTSAVTTLKSFMRLDTPYREEATKMALRRMDLAASRDWQKELAQNPDTIRLGVRGAGVIGDPLLIPWLVEQMKIPPLARVGGEAFTMISGVDLAHEDLEGKWPEGFAAGPTENPGDGNVEMDPDEDLPWPDPALVEK